LFISDVIYGFSLESAFFLSCFVALLLAPSQWRLSSDTSVIYISYYTLDL